MWFQLFLLLLPALATDSGFSDDCQAIITCADDGTVLSLDDNLSCVFDNNKTQADSWSGKFGDNRCKLPKKLNDNIQVLEFEDPSPFVTEGRKAWVDITQWESETLTTLWLGVSRNTFLGFPTRAKFPGLQSLKLVYSDYLPRPPIDAVSQFKEMDYMEVVGAHVMGPLVNLSDELFQSKFLELRHNQLYGNVVDVLEKVLPKINSQTIEIDLRLNLITGTIDEINTFLGEDEEKIEAFKKVKLDGNLIYGTVPENMTHSFRAKDKQAMLYSYRDNNDARCGPAPIDYEDGKCPKKLDVCHDPTKFKRYQDNDNNIRAICSNDCLEHFAAFCTICLGRVGTLCEIPIDMPIQTFKCGSKEAYYPRYGTCTGSDYVKEYHQWVWESSLAQFESGAVTDQAFFKSVARYSTINATELNSDWFVVESPVTENTKLISELHLLSWSDNKLQSVDPTLGADQRWRLNDGTLTIGNHQVPSGGGKWVVETKPGDKVIFSVYKQEECLAMTTDLSLERLGADECTEFTVHLGRGKQGLNTLQHEWSVVNGTNLAESFKNTTETRLKNVASLISSSPPLYKRFAQKLLCDMGEVQQNCNQVLTLCLDGNCDAQCTTCDAIGTEECSRVAGSVSCKCRPGFSSSTCDEMPKGCGDQVTCPNDMDELYASLVCYGKKEENAPDALKKWEDLVNCYLGTEDPRKPAVGAVLKDVLEHVKFGGKSLFDDSKEVVHNPWKWTVFAETLSDENLPGLLKSLESPPKSVTEYFELLPDPIEGEVNLDEYKSGIVSLPRLCFDICPKGEFWTSDDSSTCTIVSDDKEKVLLQYHSGGLACAKLSAESNDTRLLPAEIYISRALTFMAGKKERHNLLKDRVDEVNGALQLSLNETHPFSLVLTNPQFGWVGFEDLDVLNKAITDLEGFGSGATEVSELPEHQGSDDVEDLKTEYRGVLAKLRAGISNLLGSAYNSFMEAALGKIVSFEATNLLNSAISKRLQRVLDDYDPELVDPQVDLEGWSFPEGLDAGNSKADALEFLSTLDTLLRYVQTVLLREQAAEGSWQVDDLVNDLRLFKDVENMFQKMSQYGLCLLPRESDVRKRTKTGGVDGDSPSLGTDRRSTLGQTNGAQILTLQDRAAALTQGHPPKLMRRALTSKDPLNPLGMVEYEDLSTPMSGREGENRKYYVRALDTVHDDCKNVLDLWAQHTRVGEALIVATAMGSVPQGLNTTREFVMRSPDTDDSRVQESIFQERLLFQLMHVKNLLFAKCMRSVFVTGKVSTPCSELHNFETKALGDAIDVAKNSIDASWSQSSQMQTLDVTHLVPVEDLRGGRTDTFTLDMRGPDRSMGSDTGPFFANLGNVDVSWFGVIFLDEDRRLIGPSFGSGSVNMDIRLSGHTVKTATNDQIRNFAMSDVKLFGGYSGVDESGVCGEAQPILNPPICSNFRAVVNRQSPYRLWDVHVHNSSQHLTNVHHVMVVANVFGQVDPGVGRYEIPEPVFMGNLYTTFFPPVAEPEKHWLQGMNLVVIVIVAVGTVSIGAGLIAMVVRRRKKTKPTAAFPTATMTMRSGSDNYSTDNPMFGV